MLLCGNRNGSKTVNYSISLLCIDIKEAERRFYNSTKFDINAIHRSNDGHGILI